MEFPQADRQFLKPSLPPKDDRSLRPDCPFITLTFTTSLDSFHTLSPGVSTAISGTHSKAMTHCLRSRHGGILIGVGTTVADDRSSNCRITSNFTSNSKLFKLYREDRGLPPSIITSVENPPPEKISLLKEYGELYIKM
ncbi:hypothetical protein GGS24DRAFT_506422 [Hypoxylon argillaceum]|nr:hypothetical protein GGS24DRAFT_506422 [Hypoxylon argillaceum]